MTSRWLAVLGLVGGVGVTGSALAQSRAVVAPAGGNGAQKALLPVLTGSVRERVAARGWTVLTAEETGPLVQVAATPPIPSGDDLRALAGRADAGIAVHLEVKAIPGGRVLAKLRTVARQGTEGWEASEEVARADVVAAIGRLAEQAVPPATPPAPAEPPIASPTPTTEPPIVSPTPEGLPPIVQNAPPAPAVAPAPVTAAPEGAGLEADVAPAPARPLRYHLWAGPTTEGAIGTNRSYYNHLVGARATYLLTRQFGLHAVASYAYFDDDPGFALAFWGGIDARISLSSTRRTSIPVRFAVGYVPLNGAILKIEGGLLLPLAPTIDLTLNLLSPTIWFLEGGNAVSMNFGIDLAFAAG